VVATSAPVTLAVAWLVIDGELWHRPDDDSAQARERWRLYKRPHTDDPVDRRVVLSWFVASAATVGGGLGSGLESDQAIHAAAHSKREANRRDRLARPEAQAIPPVTALHLHTRPRVVRGSERPMPLCSLEQAEEC
jgi:hypothetical protein